MRSKRNAPLLIRLPFRDAICQMMSRSAGAARDAARRCSARICATRARAMAAPRLPPTLVREARAARCFCHSIIFYFPMPRRRRLPEERAIFRRFSPPRQDEPPVFAARVFATRHHAFRPRQNRPPMSFDAEAASASFDAAAAISRRRRLSPHATISRCFRFRCFRQMPAEPPPASIFSPVFDVSGFSYADDERRWLFAATSPGSFIREAFCCRRHLPLPRSPERPDTLMLATLKARLCQRALLLPAPRSFAGISAAEATRLAMPATCRLLLIFYAPCCAMLIAARRRLPSAR